MAGIDSGISLFTTDASKLTAGTLADTRLSSNVALRNVANTFTGAITQAYVATPSGTLGAIIRGLNLNSTLTAGGNNQTLTAVEINPTISVGAYTGVTALALDVKGGNSRFSGSLLFGTDNTYNIGSTSARVASIYTVNSFTTNFRAFSASGVTFYNSTGTVIATMFNTGNFTLGSNTTDTGYGLYVTTTSFYNQTATFNSTSGSGILVTMQAGVAAPAISVTHSTTNQPVLQGTNGTASGLTGIRFANDSGNGLQIYLGGTTSTVIADGTLIDIIRGDVVFRIQGSSKKFKIHNSVTTGLYSFAINPINGNVEAGGIKLNTGGYFPVKNATTPVPTEGKGFQVFDTDTNKMLYWDGTAWREIAVAS